MPNRRVKELEVVSSGTKLDSPTKGPLYRNAYIDNNAWRVRTGFGQMAQYDSTQGYRDPNNAQQGLKKHLGSRAMVTDFGHIQIISVFQTRSYTGNESEQGIWGEFTSVHIHDVTSNRHWEEILFRHTAENNPDVRPMPYWQGTFETARDVDYQAWERGNDAPLFFTEYSDHMLFGSTRLGLWAYTPADFDKNRRKQVDSASNHDWASPYSESSLIVRIHPVGGTFDRAYKYLSSADWPNTPADTTVVQGRLAIASGREVYFSDLGQPASVITENQITVPSEQEIVAIKSVSESILIFTKSETWHYTPNAGTLVSKGRLTRISPDVGCLAPSSITSVGESAFWFDVNGAYYNTGGLSLQRLSDDIEPFFTEHITDPLSSYLVAQGETDLANEQPRLTYSLTPDFVSCAYDPVQQLVLTAIPDLNLVLAYHPPKASWSLWPLESTASGTVASPTPAVVGSQRNLPNPWVTVADQRVFLVTGVEQYTMSDDTTDGNSGAPLNNNSVTSSYVICEWGRGGGLDRSVSIEEDNRVFTGQYKKYDQAASDGDYYLEEPIRLPDNYVFPGGIPGAANYGTGRTRSNVWLFPLMIRPSAQTDYPTALDLVFQFDNTRWRPVTQGPASSTIEVIFPPEREASAEGWGLGALGAVAGTAECQMYDNGTGLLDPAGDEVRLRWDAATATARATWPYANMNVCRNTKNTLLYIPFEILNPTTDTMSALGIAVTTSTAIGGAGDINMDLFAWQEGYIPDKHDDDDVAQPVDYAMKSEQLGLESGDAVYMRGAEVRMKSHGEASTQIFANHPWGTFNVTMGSDWNSWSAPLISHTGTDVNTPALENVLSKSTIRTRLRNTATDTNSKRTFNNTATWSDSTTTTTGNYLVDEEEVDSIQASAGVKGEYVDIMVFGMIRNRAEFVVVDSIKAQVIPLKNATRRKGR